MHKLKYTTTTSWLKKRKTKSIRKKQVIDVEKNKKNTDTELKAHVQDED